MTSAQESNASAYTAEFLSSETQIERTDLLRSRRVDSFAVLQDGTIASVQGQHICIIGTNGEISLEYDEPRTVTGLCALKDLCAFASIGETGMYSEHRPSGACTSVFVGAASALTASDDGSAVVGTFDGALARILNGRITTSVPGAHSSWITAVAEANNLLVSTAGTNEVCVWSLPDMTLLSKLAYDPGKFITTAAVDGNRIVIGSACGNVYIYDITNEDGNYPLTHVVRGLHRGGAIRSLVLCSDGSVISGGSDRFICVLRKLDSKPALKVDALLGPISKISSTKCNTLYVAGETGLVKLGLPLN